MRELAAENLEPYLREQGRLGPGEAVRVDLLTGGVSNVVFRVTVPRGPFILKQSRPQLRTKDAWFSDISRVWREQEVMEALAPFFPQEQVPRILFVDRPNYVFAMSHAPQGARVWKEQLLEGKIDPAMGKWAGAFLGQMHQVSAERKEDFQAFSDITIYDQLRIDPFYRRVQERRPEVARVIGPMLEEMRTRQEALCHGDYTPKNMLVHGRGFTLVDYETAHLGDPTMDLGLCLAHLLLKAVRRPEWSGPLFEVIGRFWTAYRGEVRFRPVAELESRGVAHLGALLLARVDGTSPVDYLPEEEKRDLVRRLGRRILLDGVRKWQEVLEILGNKGQ